MNNALSNAEKLLLLQKYLHCSLSWFESEQDDKKQRLLNNDCTNIYDFLDYFRAQCEMDMFIRILRDVSNFLY